MSGCERTTSLERSVTSWVTHQILNTDKCDKEIQSSWKELKGMGARLRLHHALWRGENYNGTIETLWRAWRMEAKDGRKYEQRNWFLGFEVTMIALFTHQPAARPSERFTQLRRRVHRRKTAKYVANLTVHTLRSIKCDPRDESRFQ